MRSEFDDGAITVAVYLDRVQNTPFFLLTKRDRNGPRSSIIGAHELGIKRVHNTLELRRWSRSQEQPVLWSILAFRTWEGKCNILYLIIENFWAAFFDVKLTLY